MLKNNNRAIIDTLAKKKIKNNKKNFSILFFTIGNITDIGIIITYFLSYLDLVIKDKKTIKRIYKTYLFYYISCITT